MSEVALTADDLVIIGRGRILETTTVAAFVAEHSTHSIRVATPEPDKLHAVFETAPQVTVREVPRNANDPQQGRVFHIEGCHIGTDCAGVRAGAVRDPRDTWAGAGPIRRACRNLHSAEHAGGAAMTQPHIPPQPQPVPSLGVARLVFLGHEVTPLAADEWRIPLIGLLVFKKSDIK